MARWIYQRPLDCCNLTELVVAKCLARLAEEWVIRWGFYYPDREGDFLTLGPTGGVICLSGNYTSYTSTRIRGVARATRN
jgi:hypothetical protein